MVARALSAGLSVSRPNSQVQELDSLLYDKLGACSSKPNPLYRSEVAARSPGGALVMPLGSPGEGGLLR